MMETSIYDTGVGMGEIPLTPHGAFSESPSLVKEEIETQDAEIRQLQIDVASSKLPMDKKAAVQSFVNEWRHWMKNHTTYIDRTLFVKSTIAHLGAFRDRAAKMRAILQKLKVDVTPPAPRAKGGLRTHGKRGDEGELPSIDTPPYREGFNWKKLLAVVGVGAVVIGGGFYIIRKVRKAVTPSLPSLAPHLPAAVEPTYTPAEVHAAMTQ